MRQRIYVDETKSKGYVLVAGIVPPEDCTAARKTIRGLIVPGQSRVHMKSEKTARQHLVLSTIARLGISAVVYVADARVHRTDIDRRRACLDRLVADVSESCEHLVLESDTSQDRRDRRALIELTRAHGCRSTMSYEHLTATVEPLLDPGRRRVGLGARRGLAASHRPGDRPGRPRLADVRKARAPRPRRVTSLRLPRGSAPRAHPDYRPPLRASRTTALRVRRVHGSVHVARREDAHAPVPPELLRQVPDRDRRIRRGPGR